MGPLLALAVPKVTGSYLVVPNLVEHKITGSFLTVVFLAVVKVTGSFLTVAFFAVAILAVAKITGSFLAVPNITGSFLKGSSCRRHLLKVSHTHPFKVTQRILVTVEASSFIITSVTSSCFSILQFS